MAKIKKKFDPLPHHPLSLKAPELLLSLNCQTHRFLGRDGVCLSSDCLVRKGNIENYPGECRLYDRLLKKRLK